MHNMERWKNLRRSLLRIRWEKRLAAVSHEYAGRAIVPARDCGSSESGESNRRKELLGYGATLLCAGLLGIVTITLIIFIAQKGVSTFIGTGISVRDFITGAQWNPDRLLASGGPSFGAFPFILGSFVVSMLAVVFAVPVGVGAAIFISEISPSFGEKVLRPCTELFVGIPSVVYGWIGLSVLVPAIRAYFGGLGFSLLAGGIVLSVMILPTVATVACDALKGVPWGLREAAYSLGSTRWQVISRVLIPAAAPGILTGVILGMGRAFGETLAVQMVIGNVRVIPGSLLDPGITLTTGITMDMANTVSGSLWNNALWSLAVVLLLMSVGFIALVKWVGKRAKS